MAARSSPCRYATKRPPRHAHHAQTLCPSNALRGLSPSFRNEPPGPTLNAIAPTAPETAADRTERQLRGCRELFELGMDVARAAAREAVANLDTPIEHPMPGAHLPPVCRTADPGRLFTRVAYAVRQAIALENRILAGGFGALREPGPRTPGPSHPGTAPPRASQAGFHAEGTEAFHCESLEGLGDRPPGEILADIRQTLGLAPNRASVDPAPARGHKAPPPRFAPASSHPRPRGLRAPPAQPPPAQPPPRPG